MFQQILSYVFANAWILIIVLGGLFNVSVRVAQKAKEQRAKRDALHEMSRQKQEALRTGRPIPTPESAAPQQRQQTQQSPKDRIEALRQERMAQLRALREKRAGSPTPPTASPAVSAQSTVGQSHPTLPAIPVQPRPQAQPQHRPQPMAPQQRRRRVVAPSAQPAAQRVVQRPKAPKPTERTAAKLETIRGASRSARPGLSKSSGFVPETDSARSMLRSRSSIRQAMILREILDTPIALRNQDIASGSLFS